MKCLQLQTNAEHAYICILKYIGLGPHLQNDNQSPSFTLLTPFVSNAVGKESAAVVSRARRFSPPNAEDHGNLWAQNVVQDSAAGKQHSVCSRRSRTARHSSCLRELLVPAASTPTGSIQLVLNNCEPFDLRQLMMTIHKPVICTRQVQEFLQQVTRTHVPWGLTCRDWKCYDKMADIDTTAQSNTERGKSYRLDFVAHQITFVGR
jgi:hypothetical protein